MGCSRLGATAEGVGADNAKLKRLEKLKDIASGNF